MKCLENIEASSNDRQLEKKALELKSKHKFIGICIFSC